MKVEITVERLRPARKSATTRWTVEFKATFSDMTAAGEAIRKRFPELNGEPQAGWAIRIAHLP